MKKLFVLSLLIFFSASLFADDPQTSTINLDGIGQSSSEFAECKEHSVFSQLFTIRGAFQSTSNSKMETANQFSASGSFNSVRFWMWDPHNHNTNNPVFTVNVYNGAPNDPLTTMVHATSGTAIIQPVTSSISNMYQIDIELSEIVHVNSGWLGIILYDPVQNMYTSWEFRHTEVSLTHQMIAYDGNWQSSGSNALFCLGGPPPVPFAKWALLFSAFLMVVFVAFRFGAVFSKGDPQ